ncbi:3-oxoacyl-[acyl-carrier protein] reductase [Streptosporangium subroseum]|uniref:3-oxoacyl-[acyl-carrier protein] reductase n=1 Tax=Streptosporangium subroseum TaxID=106412 RepID=A0A239NBA1_9ACTN|nr:SDR family NAD(P)-dependent oxidoreductase [Streptosporangium subroseum]SNT51518.1 3-oxoacyl-[acyl-carrier protein] reductase [Streptosporangium subroseum]
MPVLAGRTALITGGASGIGRAIVDAYVREGAEVIVADRDAEPAAKVVTEAGAVGHVVVDVSDEASVAGAVEAAMERLGRIDVLVNSAGILTEAPLVEMDLRMWTETITVDLTGVFLCCRHVVPHMVERRWGRVINIASQLGIKGGRSLSHYAAAKAGVIGFTKSLALEVAEHNVLVNAIAPGPIETPLVAGITEEWKAAKRAELPLGRFGQPEEVAPTAVLLASEPGGNLYVGQTLGPNSGDIMP